MIDRAGNIKETIKSVVDAHGFLLEDVEYITQGKRWVLRIYIDKEGGVTLDDCAGVSSEISRILDSGEVISHSYVLEVSSPGLDRPLKTINDYARYKGRLAKINTRNPYNNMTSFKGRIVSVEGEKIVVETEKEGVLEILFSDVANAKLVVEF
ncbi:MAG: ribosome maturation factor RimP [Nitrospira sp.]|nr:ribosome maturation factor RimP [Nitrospira sp.]